jgi:phage shock protein C
MYCSNCGIEVSEAFRYCPQCGTTTHKDSFRSTVGRPARILNRPREDRKIAGVCSGIAKYLGIDVTLVRVVMAVLAIWPPGVGLILYVVCWIVMPQEPLLLPPASQPSSQPAAS